MKPLLSELAKQARLRAILPHLRGRILDVGCGWTDLPRHLKTHQGYLGVDANPLSLERNRWLYPGLEFVQCDLEKETLRLDGRQFDTAIMLAVIEHLHDPATVLEQVSRSLATGGMLVVTTPSPPGGWFHRAGGRLGFFYPDEIVRHVVIYSRRKLKDLLESCGFAVAVMQYFALGMNQLVVASFPPCL